MLLLCSTVSFWGTTPLRIKGHAELLVYFTCFCWSGLGFDGGICHRVYGKCFPPVCTGVDACQHCRCRSEMTVIVILKNYFKCHCCCDEGCGQGGHLLLLHKGVLVPRFNPITLNAVIAFFLGLCHLCGVRSPGKTKCWRFTPCFRAQVQPQHGGCGRRLFSPELHSGGIHSPGESHGRPLYTPDHEPL
jgi:hypothetical protein